MKKFSISPVAVFVWLWLIVMNGAIVALNYLLAITVHELGHFLVAKKCGYKVSRFSLSPYGVELGYFNQTLNHKDEVWIAFAGPLFNLVSLVAVVSLWWIFPETYFFTESFVLISLLIACINLLPAYPLDGGRMFVCVASNFVSAKTAKLITIVSNLLLGSLFFVGFLICLFVDFNPSLLLFSFFLFVGVMDLRFSSRYERMNIFSKEMKNFSKPTFFCVHERTKLVELVKKIENTKTVLFCVVFDNGKTVFLSEKMVKNIALKYPFETKLCDIFKK